jgi:hypothetical protein
MAMSASTALVAAAQRTGSRTDAGSTRPMTEHEHQGREHQVVAEVGAHHPPRQLPGIDPGRVAEHPDHTCRHERNAEDRADDRCERAALRRHVTTSRATHFVCSTPGRFGPIRRTG